MNSLLILIPLLVVIAGFSYSVLRSMLQVWLDHRVKIALLKKYEGNPELFESHQEVIDVINEQQGLVKRPARQDYLMTGSMLSAIGIGCIVAGKIIAVGRLAVGMYLGGIVCLVLGILILLLGILIRALRRDPVAATSDS